MNDTMDPEGLVPMLLVFVCVSRFLAVCYAIIEQKEENERVDYETNRNSTNHRLTESNRGFEVQGSWKCRSDNET